MLPGFCLQTITLPFNAWSQFLPPESHTMVLPLEELDLQTFQPDPRMPFQV